MTQARDRGGAPDAGPPAGHATRRKAGARRNISKRIQLSFKGRRLEAWVLNVSRGGMRLLLETPLEAGDELEASVPLGDELEGEPVPRPVRVVWADRQVDGTFAGLEFLDVRASVRVPVARDLLPPEATAPDALPGDAARPDAGAAEGEASDGAAEGEGDGGEAGGEASDGGDAGRGGEPGDADAFGRPTPLVPPPTGEGFGD